MAWCEECWNQERKTLPATKVLDESDLCDLHYRQALGEGGLPAVPNNVPPMPSVHAPSTAEVRLPPVTVSAPLVPPEKTAAKPRTYLENKEKESMANKQRVCACRPGCTETAKSNASPYAKGHNPNATKEAPPPAHNGKDKRPVKNRGGQISNGGGASVHIPLTVTVPLRGEHLDALWGRLSLQEKADKLFPAE